ncbi:MAG: hypothetical protein DHS20C14_21130 [Phycisphaeraceae bacterium]|nr:MAG: hypothetical protein DHS20C14_21130 [Phycisphaeraceae bacterium]
MDDQTPAQPQQQVQLRIDESKTNTAYANMFRTTPTSDEVLLDAGLHVPAQGQDGSPAIVFAIGHRTVMSWGGAKRLVMQLGQLVRSYEERYGEIPVQGSGGQAAAPPPPPPGG